jgi:hypothetical protein
VCVLFFVVPVFVCLLGYSHFPYFILHCYNMQLYLLFLSFPLLPLHLHYHYHYYYYYYYHYYYNHYHYYYNHYYYFYYHYHPLYYIYYIIYTDPPAAARGGGLPYLLPRGLPQPLLYQRTKPSAVR